MKNLWIFTICICIFSIHALPTRHDKRKKKYVIEVQDHQQAMKYADPMVDLEETVRRGISDPLNDPNFIMNRVNEDYFHRNFAHDTSSLYGGVLPQQSIQTSMHSAASVFDLTPQRTVADNAVKSSLVTNHASSLMRYKPQRPVQENAGKMGSIPHAPLINALRKLLAIKQNNKINNLHYFTKNGENINPLTGLPEDLESKSYGAITSIESVSDQSEHQPPQTVTVNINTASVRRNQQKPAVNRHRIASNFMRTKPQPKIKENLMSNSIGSNYDSIQSFLEADNILRKKFSDNNNIKIN